MRWEIGAPAPDSSSVYRTRINRMINAADRHLKILDIHAADR
jgi:hypothetical protein